MLPNHAPLVDRRAVRHAGRAVSRPHRPRPRAARRAPTRPTARALRRNLDGRCRRASRRTWSSCMGYFADAEPRPGACGPFPAPGTRGAGLDPRLEPVRRAARRRISGCPTPSPRTSRRAADGGRRASTARTFRPSAQLAAPHVMLGCNVFAADTDEEARCLFTSMQQAFVNLRSGRPTQLPPPRPGYPGQAGAGRTAVCSRTSWPARPSARRTRCASGCVSPSSAPAADRTDGGLPDPSTTTARLRSYELLAGA